MTNCHIILGRSACRVGALTSANPPSPPRFAKRTEIGVRTEAVRVLGALSSLWVIVSNHLVQPFIGATDTKPEFRLAAGEVEALVELPLASLHDITRIGRERRVRDGIDVDYPYFKLAGHQVWGATAMILGEFGALFEPDFGPGST